MKWNIIRFIILILFFSLTFNFNKMVFCLTVEEYINKINQLIHQQENILERANKILKDIQKVKKTQELLQKFFEIISQSEAMIEEAMNLNIPTKFDEAHINLILYIKWSNLALYEVLNDINEDKSKFCLQRAFFYIKKFEKLIGPGLLIKRNEKLEFERKEKSKNKTQN